MTQEESPEVRPELAKVLKSFRRETAERFILMQKNGRFASIKHQAEEEGYNQEEAFRIAEEDDMIESENAQLSQREQDIYNNAKRLIVSDGLKSVTDALCSIYRSKRRLQKAPFANIREDELELLALKALETAVGNNPGAGFFNPEATAEGVAPKEAINSANDTSRSRGFESQRGPTRPKTHTTEQSPDEITSESYDSRGPRGSIFSADRTQPAFLETKPAHPNGPRGETEASGQGYNPSLLKAIRLQVKDSGVTDKNVTYVMKDLHNPTSKAYEEQADKFARQAEFYEHYPHTDTILAKEFRLKEQAARRVADVFKDTPGEPFPRQVERGSAADAAEAENIYKQFDEMDMDKSAETLIEKMRNKQLGRRP